MAMTRKLFSVDVGNLCVLCLQDTSLGSGLFVNRIPGDTPVCNKKGEQIGMRSGYYCPKCGGYNCDRCDEPIWVDCDYMAHCCYGEDVDEFPDGAVHICEDCLTPKEKQLMEELDQ